MEVVRAEIETPVQVRRGRLVRVFVCLFMVYSERAFSRILVSTNGKQAHRAGMNEARGRSYPSPDLRLRGGAAPAEPGARLGLDYFNQPRRRASSIPA